MKTFLSTVVLSASLAFPSVAGAAGIGADPAAEPIMAERAASNPPIGYVQFCRDHAEDCRGLGSGQRVSLTAETWRELVDVNDTVNRSVIPATDMEIYGVVEYWTYPTTHGDCEDYALLKRRVLIERGWPASALLMTVVRDHVGDGHAVLTVLTTSGDLVLDNQNADVLLWHDTGYDFVKRQSNAAPNQWVSLQDEAPRHDVPVAGTEPR